MAIEAGLEEFTEDFHQEMISRSEFQDSADFRINVMTQMFVEHLTDAGELEDGHVCYYKSRGMEVNGYGFSHEGECLDLFGSIYVDQPGEMSIGKDQIEASLKRLLGFFDRSRNGLHVSLEKASPVFDMSQRIHELNGQIDKVRLFVFANGQIKTKAKSKSTLTFKGVKVTVHLWDTLRLFRCLSSGGQRETIEIDIAERFGDPVPCLAMKQVSKECRVYLAAFPGRVLYEIYEEFGPRLLELNVRSFLQARGKVNQGIRKTILEQPGRFLAYNNGISATAESVRLVELPNGGHGIGWIRNLQIVNGGQTTASIHQAVKKDGADITNVFVQVKLSVIPPDQLSEMVPLISRYANSQNKVSDADFSANDPFHVRVEALSRTIWAPAADGTQKQTRWFYERARGQYLDEKGRANTPAKKKDFLATHPTHQKFTKTDLAKYANTWDQLPHLVSLGAQKNFLEFTLRQSGNGKTTEFTVTDFHYLIAQAVLFKEAERLVQQLDFGGYRANIVTYTLAYLSWKTNKRIDLGRIWREQGITSALSSAIEDVAKEVHQIIVEPPGGKNVTEWCKKEGCWDAVRKLEVKLSSSLQKELTPE
jgi:hypothetical protein